MVLFTDSLDTLTPDQLQGFFVGWPNPPYPAPYLELLTLSTYSQQWYCPSSRILNAS